MLEPPLSIAEPENYEAKEVYAFFGLAAYCSQVFEQAALHLAAALHVYAMSPRTQEGVDATWDRLDRQTLGQLLASARQLTTIDPTIDELLCAAIDRRNDLVHRFFERNSERFMVESGRKSMIQELREATGLFQRADRAATELFLPISSAMGLTEEVIEATFERMKADLEAREAAL